MGLVVTIGSTATVTIAPAARGHVVIDNPAARNLGLGGVTSSTYDSCPHAQGFFAQGFAFTHRPTRGCVPLDVTIDNRPLEVPADSGLVLIACSAEPGTRSDDNPGGSPAGPRQIECGARQRICVTRF